MRWGRRLFIALIPWCVLMAALSWALGLALWWLLLVGALCGVGAVHSTGRAIRLMEARAAGEPLTAHDDVEFSAGDRRIIQIAMVVTLVSPITAVALIALGHGTLRLVGVGVGLLAVLLYFLPTVRLVHRRAVRRALDG